MTTINLDDLSRLARLAPDLRAGQVTEIMEWIAELRGGAVVRDPASDAVSMAPPAAVIGGGLAEPTPAAPPPSRATKGGAAPKREPKPAGKGGRGPGREWSREELEQALVMRGKGLTVAQVAARLGRSAKAVSVALSAARLERYGLAPTAPQKDIPDAAPGLAGQTAAQADSIDIGDPPECPAVDQGPAAAPVTDLPDPAALAAQGAAVVVALPSSGRLTSRQSRLVDHLGRLGNDSFLPEDDLFLAEQLARGVPGNVVADQLGCDLKTAGLRFRAMQTEEIVNAKGVLTIDGQADLLVALRYRAGIDD